jgi:hypothetical protein
MSPTVCRPPRAVGPGDVPMSGAAEKIKFGRCVNCDVPPKSSVIAGQNSRHQLQVGATAYRCAVAITHRQES